MVCRARRGGTLDRYGTQTQIGQAAVHRHAGPGVRQPGDGLQLVCRDRHGAVPAAADVLPVQAGDVRAARPGADACADEDRLPALPPAGGDLDGAGDGRVRAGGRAVWAAHQRRAALVRHRRHRRAAVRVRQDRRHLLRRGHPRTPHGPHRRSAPLAASGRRRPRLHRWLDHAAARSRNRLIDHRDRERDGLCRGHQLSLHRRPAARLPTGGLHRVDECGLPPAAHEGVPRSVERSARRRVPGHSITDRRGHRRLDGARTDGRRAEAVLPALSAHRLHLRGDRRRTRSSGDDGDPRVLLRDRVARPAHVDARPGSVRRLSRARPHRDGRRPGVLQHQRGARTAADEGHSAAVRQFRRVIAAHEHGGHGHPAQRLATRIGVAHRHDGNDDGGCMSLRVVIGGGGTGGHLYPGVAIAREILARRPDATVTFAGTARGIETKVIPREGFQLDVLRSAGLKGRSAIAALRGVALLPASAWDVWRILSRRQPDVVIGVGGYSSGPVVMVAALRGIPTLIAEQNAVPGLTNRLLSWVVSAAAVTFDSTVSFFGRRGFVAGNPVRPEFLSPGDGSARPDGPPRVLIFGGSQGAHAINVAMVEAAPRLAAAGGVDVTHQTGERDVELVRRGYRDAGLTARVEPFLYAMDREMKQADVIVSRAGATTIAELTAAGRAAILIPLPTAADDHQKKNAEVLARAGAAELIEQKDLTGAALAERVLALATDATRRQAVAAAARRFARPDAAKAIVDKALELARC